MEQDEPDMEDTQPGIEQDETTELGQEVAVSRSRPIL